MPLDDARLKAMAGSHYVAIDVRYEPGVRDGTSLAWIAPELRDDGLDLIEDHLDEPKPSRIWAGCVDGPTFKRFATAWALDRSDEDFGRSEDRPCYEQTFDGMNWEVDGVSPIISVSVRTHACGAPRKRGPDARLENSVQRRRARSAAAAPGSSGRCFSAANNGICPVAPARRET